MNKIKQIFCVFFGHAKIVTTCFGYVSCARCEVQIGDTLAGLFSLENYVIKEHNCSKCRDNYKKLKFREKFLCGNPFKEKK